jgi:hypothetical protein
MQQWIARVRTIFKELSQKDFRKARLLLVIELVLGFTLVAFLLVLIRIFLY